MSDSYNPSRHEYGQTANLVLNRARIIAHANGYEHLRSDHLLAGIVDSGGCNMTLIRLGTGPVRLVPLLARHNPTRPSEEISTVPALELLRPSRIYQKITEQYAHRTAEILRKEEIDSECLLGGILMTETGLGYQILHREGLSLGRFFEALLSQGEEGSLGVS